MQLPSRRQFSERSGDRAPSTTVPAGNAASKLFEKLLRKASRKLDDNPLAGSSFLLLGFGQTDAISIREQMRRLGAPVTATCSDIAQIADVPGMGAAFNGVVVNIDAFDDLDEAVDALLEFRIRAPRMIVILVSAKVANDDFGCERRPIGDVTLRAPVSERRLQQALHTGLRRAVGAIG